MRGKTRYLKLLKTFEGQQCPCNEAESYKLIWYPHHNTIHSYYVRWGENSKQRQEADKLINESRVLCANCEKELYHTRITNDDIPFHLQI